MLDKNEILYTFKQSYHISHNEDCFCCVGETVDLYNINDGKQVFKFGISCGYGLCRDR